MKKIYGFILVLLTILAFHSNLSAQCSTVTVEVFPLDPQSGNHNYFGIRVTLAQTFGENVTINGYIHDEGDPNTNHPFELTVTTGNLAVETSATFYETSPTASAVVDVSSVTNCPYSEATIATYSLTNQTYTINISSQNETLLSAIEDMFSVENASIDSLMIYDDDPSTIDSASYIVFYVTATNTKFSFGIYLEKYSDNNQIIYTVNNREANIESNRQAGEAIAWECKKQTSCYQCGPHRNWFLGPVRGCDCENSGQTNDCIYNTSGSGIPWAALIGFLGVLLGILF